jgi:hypothetical protein
VTEGGAATDALATHVDLAATLCALGGVDVDATPTLSGVDLRPTLADPSVSPRDHVFFSQDSAQSALLRSVRYAVRGFFDGTTNTPATTASAAVSRETAARPTHRSSSTSTPPSKITTTSGTTSTGTPTSWSTWPTTPAAAMSYGRTSNACSTSKRSSWASDPRRRPVAAAPPGSIASPVGR